MTASSVKDQVLRAIERLPADAGFRDVAEEIALLAAVAEAEDDITNGRLVDQDEMKIRMEAWLRG